MRRTRRAGRELRPSPRQPLNEPVIPPAAAGPIRIVCTGTVNEATLAQIEAALERHPDAVDLQFARACLLEDLGRLTRARGAYKAVLARDPAHFGALTNLATLLFRANQRPQARALYREAALRHPAEPIAHINLRVLADDEA